MKEIGRRGGKARAANLSAEERSKIARQGQAAMRQRKLLKAKEVNELPVCIAVSQEKS